MTDYCVLADVKDWAQLSDTNDDAVITSIITAVSRWIDNHCGRHFFQSTEARTFIPRDFYFLDLAEPGAPVNDIALNTGITIKTDPAGDGTFPTTWVASDFELAPYNAPYVNGEAWPWNQVRATGTQTFPVYFVLPPTARRDRVQITATWGWPAIPAAVKQACIMQSARVFKRRSSPEGVAGFGDIGAVRVTSLDVDVARLLDGYRRGGTAAGLAIA